jgi:hypothetical protein
MPKNPPPPDCLKQLQTVKRPEAPWYDSNGACISNAKGMKKLHYYH